MSAIESTAREAIRAALARERQAVLNEIRSAASELEQHQYGTLLNDSPGDSSDEALAVSLADLSAARMEHDMRRWRELEAAERRIDDPDFGLCGECGGPIPEARLVAQPGASRCVACQDRHEKTYAGQPRGSL